MEKNIKKWRIRSLLVGVFLCSCALRLGIGVLRDNFRRKAEIYATLEQMSLRVADRMDEGSVELRKALLETRKALLETRKEAKEIRGDSGVDVAGPSFLIVEDSLAELERAIAEREAQAKSSRQEAAAARQWREHYQRLGGQSP